MLARIIFLCNFTFAHCFGILSAWLDYVYNGFKYFIFIVANMWSTLLFVLIWLLQLRKEVIKETFRNLLFCDLALFIGWLRNNFIEAGLRLVIVRLRLNEISSIKLGLYLYLLIRILSYYCFRFFQGLHILF